MNFSHQIINTLIFMMSNKLFYKSNDRLLFSSYKKSNLHSLAGNCIRDVTELQNYIQKIIKLRLYTLRYVFAYMLSEPNITSLQIYDAVETCTHVVFQFVVINYNVVSFHKFYRIHISEICNNSVFLYNMYGLLFCYYVIDIELCKFVSFYKNGLGSLPIKRTKFTVLRSPHTDKKSREQFERCTHRKLYVFPTMLSEFYSFLCEKNYVFSLCTVIHETSKLCDE